MKYLFYLLLAFITLTACKETAIDTDVNKALEIAGKNRHELEYVLNHYSCDPEKLAAAKFLIANMPGHYSYADSVLINKYYDEVDIILEKIKESKREIIADSINAIAHRLKIQDIGIVQDIEIITANFLIRNIDDAFNEWKNGQWAKQLSFEQFCELLLPYKVTELQPLDSWREDFHNFLTDSLNELKFCDLYKNSPYRAAIIMNKIIGDSIRPFIWNGINSPIYRLSTRFKIPFGPCDDYSYLTTALFRSIGIPTSTEINPHWAYRSLGHKENAVLATNGKFIPFTGLSTGPEYTLHVDEKKAKIFRSTYARNKKIEKLHNSGEFVAEPFHNWFLKDVTDEYTNTANITISTSNKNDGYVYLAVYGDNDWYPVDFSILSNNTVSFNNVGTNVLYILIRYDSDGNMYTLTNPFILDSTGILNFITPNIEERITAVIYRKFPVIEYVHKYARLIIDGEFEASNDSNFTNSTLIHKITDGYAIGHEIQISKSLPSFRYWRYIQRHHNAHCNMAEIYFFNERGEKLSGSVIGTKGHRTIYEKMTRENLFDGNLLTSFNSPNPNGDWAGLDFGEPKQLSRIIFYGRGDGNTVEIGDCYELFYWDNNDWQSIGQKTADSIALIYDNIPQGALLLLRDLTKGKDERVFIIGKHGEQEWW